VQPRRSGEGIPHVNNLLFGRTVRGIIQGDSIPQLFVPQLIELYRAGDFPFDRLVRVYEFEEINQAVADVRSGATVKPIPPSERGMK
jgi:aryl-alcohol dehydrogenase